MLEANERCASAQKKQKSTRREQIRDVGEALGSEMGCMVEVSIWQEHAEIGWIGGRGASWRVNRN